MLKILERLRQPPSGRRHKSTVAASVTAGVQPSRQGLPHVIPDFLTPETHMSVAQSISHPFALPPLVHPAIAKALAEQDGVAKALVERRPRMLEACGNLAAGVAGENESVL